MSGIEKCKLLIIGLDGVSFDLLDPWFEDGELPHLRRLKEEGCAGPLMSVPNLHSAAAWTSMVTGKNPGKHGVYFFVERDRDLNYKFFSGADRKTKAIWNILNEGGMTTGIINVPMTFPAEAVKGIMISGLDSPSIKDKRSIYPSYLTDTCDVLKERYDIVPPVQDLIQKEKPDTAVQKWLDIISSRIQLCEQLFENFTFDFFMITFLASDWANHNLWKYCDPSYPLYSEEKGKKFGHLLLEIYKKLDFAVGELLRLSGPDTNIMVVSDHGAGKHQLGSFYLTDWMIQNQFMFLVQQSRWKSLPKHTSDKTITLMKKLIPHNIQESAKGKFPKLRKLLREKKREQVGQYLFESIDWTKTKAYTEMKAHNIWINLIGKWEHGIVNPGKEYKELCHLLKGKLSDWKDEKTGRPVVENVFHKDEIYQGPYSERAPDLQIRWNDNVVLYPARRSLFGKRIQKMINEGWSGDHRLNGIFLARGPKFKKGAWADNLSIYDVTPTALCLLDFPVEVDYDGRVIREFLVD